VGKNPSDVNLQAPIHWVPREEFFAYFNILTPEDRWSNPQYRERQMIWHWKERRWWALEEED
jgi:hypothetical protein